MPAPKKKTPPESKLRETPFQIRLTAEEKRMFTAAADRQHLTLSAWLRLAALHAAKSDHVRG